MTWMKKCIHSLRAHLAAVIAVLLGCYAVALWWPTFWVCPVSGKSVVEIKSDPMGSMDTMIGQALEDEKAGRLIEATIIYENLLKQYPKQTVIYFKLGAIYFRSGFPIKAEEAYLKAIEQGVNDPDVYLYLGYIKETQGKLEPALEYYAKAKLAASSSPVLYFNMGNVNAQLGHFDKALEDLKHAVILNPDYMDAFVNLSIISAQAGEYADAQYYLEKAEKLGYHAPVEYKEGLKKYLRL
ncbi:MAG: tetratricopeptide repeat protein [Candidatus Omnitrophota bacterium]